MKVEISINPDSRYSFSQKNYILSLISNTMFLNETTIKRIN
jgi:hypothetical protein